MHPDCEPVFNSNAIGIYPKAHPAALILNYQQIRHHDNVLFTPTFPRAYLEDAVLNTKAPYQLGTTHIGSNSIPVIQKDIDNCSRRQLVPTNKPAFDVVLGRHRGPSWADRNDTANGRLVTGDDHDNAENICLGI